MLTVDDFEDLWIPQRPYATNDFSNGIHRMAKNKALKHRWVNNNTKSLKNLIVLDIDKDHSEWHIKSLVEDEGIIPEPNFITINPATDHSQVGYFIEGFVHSDKAQRWFKNISTGLTVLSAGDPAYGFYTMRNPTHTHQRTLWGTDKLYSLGELNNYIKELSSVEYKNLSEEDCSFGRNKILFDSLRKWGYHNKRKYSSSSYWSVAIHERANELNCSLDEPLPSTEIKSLVKSVDKWIWNNFNDDTFRKIQKARSAKREVVKNANSRAFYIVSLVEEDKTITEISEILGISYGASKIAIKRSKERIFKLTDNYL